MSRRSSSDGALFVGRLSKTCRVRDLEDVFEPYGRMARCEIKYGAEMAYAFVDYEDKRDAEDAIRYENGREVAGSAIIVEWAKGAPRRGGRDVRESSSRSRGNVSSTGMDECYRCHRSGHWARDCPDDRHYGYRRPSKRSPRRSSRRSRSRSYSRERHRSRSGSRDKRRRRKSKSRSRSRSRSRSYERKQSKSNSRSRSRSRSKSRSKSHSKSRSRSRSVNDKEVNGNKSKSRSKSPQENNSSP